MSSYEKQMKWAKARQRETDAKRSQQKSSEEIFQPHLFHGRVKEFEGSAREINDRSAQKFIERMRRGNGLGSARSVTSASNESAFQFQHTEPAKMPSSSFSADGSRKSPANNPSNTISNTVSHININSNAVTNTANLNPNNSNTSFSASEIVASYSGQYATQAKPLVATRTNFGYGGEGGYQYTEEPSELSKLDNGDDMSSDSDSGEPIIEMLERERRQWQAERERLIQCIHLQQLEMSQRALAAHERAVEIAKDFAKLIETFENRLETVETNVQKELGGLKLVTESLLVAVNKLSTPQPLPSVAIASTTAPPMPSLSQPVLTPNISNPTSPTPTTQIPPPPPVGTTPITH